MLEEEMRFFDKTFSKSVREITTMIKEMKKKSNGFLKWNQTYHFNRENNGYKQLQKPETKDQRKNEKSKGEERD